jgi:hypothetical protein
MFKNGNVKHKSTNYGTILHPEEFYQTRNKGQSHKIWDVYIPYTRPTGRKHVDNLVVSNSELGAYHANVYIYKPYYKG